MTRGCPARILSVQTEVDDPFVAYALGLAELATGLRLTLVPSDDSSVIADVYYGNDTGRYCRIRIPYLSRYRRETIPPVPGSQARDAARTMGAPFPFDLFAALRFWLADEGNVGADADRDEHGRVIAEASAQWHVGAVRVPIVNAYLALFRSWIETRTQLATHSPLPTGKRCALVLTHDVDSPIGPADPRHRTWLALADARRGRPRRAVRHLREAARGLRGSATAASTTSLFRDIVRAEERCGFRSTFFFAPVSSFSPMGHPFDVRYDLTAPRFRRVTRELTARGAEIGLHVSYSALGDRNRIAYERELVEAVAGVDVLGCRHHYFHTSEPLWPSLDAHAAAGLRYDSSVCFAREAGFRLGLAFVARLWNPSAERPISALQIPPMAMDGHFYYKPSQTLEDTLSEFLALLDRLKEYEGVAALDWHEYTASRSSAAYGHWADGYRAILDVLASDREVVVLTCAEAMVLGESAAPHR
jgi:hypothetical protein